MPSKTPKTKIVVVLGPTAVGKSDFAVTLAKKHDGEIVSADSRQIYTGGDLMSGKIAAREMRGITHHLLSIASMKRAYSVTNYVRDAKKAIAGIQKRNKLAIVCGGTAMYIDALIYGQVFPGVKPNAVLRKELAKKSTDQLFKMLKKLDPERAETIDSHNPHRLVRAIEIATALGKVPPLQHTENPYDVLLLGLTLPKEELHTRIQKRIDKRMRQGILKEVDELRESGLSYARIESFGLEFARLTQIVTGALSKKEALGKLYTDIVHFTKRQNTWWKRNKDIHWLAPTDINTAEKLVSEFIQK